ncbi:cubilin-like [Hyposmocoma kahamanoa]|uniref:cubilin-like n=1 Tax=Hyposmocoma kahamanoa TaxID=1477025 RepID=UPI000E6D8F0E|nr:cubilin-like [Hyposmocoma kahamanoa]
MRARTAPALLLVAIIASLHSNAEACEPGELQNGCKIYGTSCTCGYGCKTEYIYRSRRECLNVLTEKNSNICSRRPCIRGICLQTMQDPGFTCKCEGTGYYGMRCEKACPTVPTRGLVFPHECIVI